MSRPCTVCAHKRLEAIDKALVAGDTFRALSRQYKLSRDALRRHKMEHLPETMVKAQGVVEMVKGDNLLDQLTELQNQAKRIADQAEQAKNFSAALGGIRELVRIVELLAKLRGELQEGATVNLFVSTEWTNIQALMVSVLEPFPEARLAVVKALEESSHANLP